MTSVPVSINDDENGDEDVIMIDFNDNNNNNKNNNKKNNKKNKNNNKNNKNNKIWIDKSTECAFNNLQQTIESNESRSLDKVQLFFIKMRRDFNTFRTLTFQLKQIIYNLPSSPPLSSSLSSSSSSSSLLSSSFSRNNNNKKSRFDRRNKNNNNNNNNNNYNYGSDALTTTYTKLYRDLIQTMKETLQWKSMFIKALASSKQNISFLIESTKERQFMIRLLAQEFNQGHNIYNNNTRNYKTREMMADIVKWTEDVKLQLNTVMTPWNGLVEKANSLKAQWTKIAQLCGESAEHIRPCAEEMAQNLHRHSENSKCWKNVLFVAGCGLLGLLVGGLVGGIVGLVVGGGWISISVGSVLGLSGGLALGSQNTNDKVMSDRNVLSSSSSSSFSLNPQEFVEIQLDRDDDIMIESPGRMPVHGVVDRTQNLKSKSNIATNIISQISEEKKEDYSSEDDDKIDEKRHEEEDGEEEELPSNTNMNHNYTNKKEWVQKLLQDVETFAKEQWVYEEYTEGSICEDFFERSKNELEAIVEVMSLQMKKCLESVSELEKKYANDLVMQEEMIAMKLKVYQEKNMLNRIDSKMQGFVVECEEMFNKIELIWKLCLKGENLV